MNPLPPSSAKDRTKDFFVSVPKPSMPGPSGASTLGEQFSVRAATGSASFSIPLALSPGREGGTPAIALSYDSGAGHGPFGYGWSLDVASIRRKTNHTLPRYRDTDAIVGPDGDDLVPKLVEDGGDWVPETRAPDGYRVAVHRPRTERAFACVERWTSTSTGEVHWRVRSPDNALQIYGLSSNARIADPADATRVFAWLLESSFDERGHGVAYTYKAEDRAGAANATYETARRLTGCTNKYLKSVKYGNLTPDTFEDGHLYEVVFDYGEHDADDPQPDDAGTWDTRQDVTSSFRAGFDIRTYRVCKRVLMFHNIPGETDPTVVRSTEFTYDADMACTRLTSVTVRGWMPASGGGYDTATLPPVSYTYTEAEIGSQIETLDNAEPSSPSPDPAQATWIDLYGEGLSGLLTERGGAWYYQRSRGGGKLDRATRLESRPAVPLGLARWMDVDGDGRAEAMVKEPVAGFYDGKGTKFGTFVRFESIPTEMDSPNARMLDLDGDGLLEVLMTSERGFHWYRSTGRKGWAAGEARPFPADERDGPRLLFSNAGGSVFFADMTGDGLADLVRIGPADVVYWPNLGYGRFGAKVTMAHAPLLATHDRFDPRRVRLSDVDGTGGADLIYLGVEGARLYFNQAGNRWSDGVALRGFPAVADPENVFVEDVRGDGTMALVWRASSFGAAPRPIRYLSLMAAGVPNLMKEVDNHQGALTTLTYTASTVFMVEDRVAGTPWATELPFPVQCLSHVETVERITGSRRVQRMRYRHGFYDPAEREFRGFGLVETWDNEDFSRFDGEPTLEKHGPPIRTRTWTHTGAWLEQLNLLDAYAKEYWNGDEDLDPETSILPVVPLPTGSAPREAARALRGFVLRTEVFADDESADAAKPYTVSTSQPVLRRLQPETTRHQAVHQIVAGESLSRSYDRVADDPRTSHSIPLVIDDYGTVTRAAAVSYPRRGSGHPDQQVALTIVITESAVIHDDAAPGDQLHLGVPTMSRVWSLTGTDAHTDIELATADSLNDDFESADPIDGSATPTGGTTLEKRLLGDDRIAYWKDDLTGAEDLGAMGSKRLAYETYRLTFTDDTLTAGYGTLVDSTMLTEAGYVELDGIDGWFVPSGRATLRGAAHFYTASSVQDAFGNATALTWDDVDRHVIEAEDLLGNTVSAEIDYRVQSPWKVTDANGTETQAEFDELGRVTKTAMIGPDGEGDTLSSPTTTVEYELSGWDTDGSPSMVHATAREVHTAVSSSTRLQESWKYFDGRGREVMVKKLVAPGEAPLRDEDGELERDGGGAIVLGAADPRYVASGRVVRDDKDRAIKQYEPFFSSTSAFEDEADVVETGVTAVNTYDSVGRLLQVDLPNGTRRRTTYGAWESTAYDENDCSEDEDLTADPDLLARAADHADTPTTTWMDAQGRAFRVDQRTAPSTILTTTVTLDVLGEATVVTDARSIATQTQVFDRLGRPMKTMSPDAGDSWALVDATGQPCRGWKDGGLSTRATYDVLRRPVRLYVTEGSTERIKQLVIYGEFSGVPGTGHFKGRPYRTYDTAGVVTINAYDFLGRPLSESRAFCDDPDAVIDWSGLSGSSVSAIETQASSLVESADYDTTRTYDALGRVVTETTPDNSVTTNGYDVGGALITVAVNVRGAGSATNIITGITYNARGQRLVLTRPGTTTTYAYDPETWRLTALTSTRTSDSHKLQDLAYTYDPVGNITEITDGALQTEYFNNTVVAPTRTFTYDALYRLIEGTGRENDRIGQHTDVDPTQQGVPFNNTTGAVRNYTQSYEYDAVGNILEMSHFVGSGSSGNWTRHYEIATDSNRLLTTSIPADTSAPYSDAYSYNARGAMTAMPTSKLSAITVDFRDQICAVDLGSGDAVYAYDGGSKRVRKVVRNSPNTEERRYIGRFEIWTKKVSGTQTEAVETLHVMDDQRRIMLIDTLTVHPTVTTPLTNQRFQLDDQIGSACVEVDQSGAVISYEEYHPYGSTAYWGRRTGEVSGKRYRYTGMEKDDETGLSYHHHRYLAVWLGRWCSSDPARATLANYDYADNNPGRVTDRSGRAGEEESWGSWAWNQVTTAPGRAVAWGGGFVDSFQATGQQAWTGATRLVSDQGAAAQAATQTVAALVPKGPDPAVAIDRINAGDYIGGGMQIAADIADITVGSGVRASKGAIEVFTEPIAQTVVNAAVIAGGTDAQAQVAGNQSGDLLQKEGATLVVVAGTGALGSVGFGLAEARLGLAAQIDAGIAEAFASEARIASRAEAASGGGLTPEVSGTLRTFAKSGPGGSGRISIDQAAQAAERHGIDMRMFSLRHDPTLPEGVYGFVSQTLDKNFNPAGIVRGADGRIVLTLGDSGLGSVQAAVETIAHELNHVRGYLLTGQMSSEASAEAAALAARPHIR